jgi:hypothetical protein
MIGRRLYCPQLLFFYKGDVMKKIILVLSVFALTASAFAETSIGFSFGGYSNFSYFNPAVSADVAFDPLEIFIGASFAIIDDKRNENYPLTQSWLRLQFGIAPFLVKTESLKVSLPISLAWMKRDHNKNVWYTESDYGDWIAINAGLKVSKNITDHFDLYCGACMEVFGTNVTDIEKGGTISYKAGKINYWFYGGYVELGARFYLEL